MLQRHTATPDAAPATANALPGDIRAMNAIAALVFALAVLGIVAAGAKWLVLRPRFAFGAIELTGDLQRNNVTTVRANALPHLVGTFFTMDLSRARAAFEQVPWVRHAVVRRE